MKDIRVSGPSATDYQIRVSDPTYSKKMIVLYIYARVADLCPCITHIGITMYGLIKSHWHLKHLPLNLKRAHFLATRDKTNKLFSKQANLFKHLKSTQ